MCTRVCACACVERAGCEEKPSAHAMDPSVGRWTAAGLILFEGEVGLWPHIRPVQRSRLVELGGGWSGDDGGALGFAFPWQRAYSLLSNMSETPHISPSWPGRGLPHRVVRSSGEHGLFLEPYPPPASQVTSQPCPLCWLPPDASPLGRERGAARRLLPTHISVGRARARVRHTRELL